MAGNFYVSPATEAWMNPTLLAFTRKLARDGQIADFNALLSAKDNAWDGASEGLRQTFKRAGIDPNGKVAQAVNNKVLDLDISARGSAANTSEAAAMPLRPDGKSGGVIFYDRVTDMNVYATRMAGIPLDGHRLPGSAADYDAANLFHELSHLGDRQDNFPGKGAYQEYHAESGGNFLYYLARANGVVSDPEVPYANRALYAVSAIVNPLSAEDTHLLAAVNPLPNEINLNITGSDANNASARAAIDAIHREAGYRILDFDKYTGDNYKQDALKAGSEAIKDDPSLAYAVAKNMAERGDFDRNPVGGQLVANFIDGAQRYFPEQFGVEPENTPAQRPAIVDNLERVFPAPRPEQAMDTQRKMPGPPGMQ